MNSNLQPLLPSVEELFHAEGAAQYLLPPPPPPPLTLAGISQNRRGLRPNIPVCAVFPDKDTEVDWEQREREKNQGCEI